MAKRMLIDSTHPEETRVTVVSGNRLEEFDYETATKKQLKGNIYLAKVTRVEPSLQAAFVEYGGNRHGFLAFSEIHPDYYRIPVSDRDDLVDEDQDDDNDHDNDAPQEGESVEELGGDEGAEEAEQVKRRPRLKRQYKIQEVIKRRQVLLVQVVKEERGNKGAALTTYLSLAGRYCVLMPNTSRGGGVSRKITNVQDRKRLKKILAEMSVPEGMAVILRTAGAERSKAEIRRDFDYIFKLWDHIRTRTLESTAPALINEEANLIKRALRDLYAKDMEEILVAGDEGYRTAKDFMKSLIPSHAKKVQRYRDNQGIPLFQRYQVENQLAAIHDPTVLLRSGGSIVIHQTEALVSIDVNSGKATRERHIEETALKTNLEAAEEIARQLRLRDMAGLIVIDFIDMDDQRNDQAVERKLKETLKKDRARIQVGRISPFGLLEMSRQRLRPSILEAITQPCPNCGGTGYIQSTESAALSVLRNIEEEGLRRRSSEVTVRINPDVAMYIMNHKRQTLNEMERNCEFHVVLQIDDKLLPAQFEMTRIGKSDEDQQAQPVEAQPVPVSPQAEEESGESRSKKRRRRRRGKKRGDEAQAAQQEETTQVSEEPGEENEAIAADDSEDDSQKKRRKRGRRGGRRRGRGRRGDEMDQETGGEQQQAQPADQGGEEQPQVTDGDKGEAQPEAAQAETGDEGQKPRRPRRQRRPRKAEQSGEAQAAEPAQAAAAETTTADVVTIPIEVRDQAADSPQADNAAKAPESGENAANAPAEAAADPPPAEAKEEAKPAKKTRAKKTRAKKATAKKTTAKKTRAKKASAKKAAAAKPAAKAQEAAKEPAAAAESRQPKTVSEPAASQPAAPAPQPQPAAKPEPAPAPQQQAEEAPKGPKRKGWWSKVLGS